MKAFLAAVLAVIGIGFIASIILETQQRNADAAYATSGARVDADPRLSGGKVQKH
jgi:hypothetical protein